MNRLCVLMIGMAGLMTSCQSDLASHSPVETDPTAPSLDAVQPSLTNTYWRPVEIAGKPVDVAANQREPHLILVFGENKMRGFGGCNQMQGLYEVQGDGLRFIGTATTRMFCQETMEQEGAFLHAIESTTRYKLVGETLELYDMNGELLARFESKSLR
ncbi:MAG: META domain-containing protein [Nitrospirales bacterium]